MIWPEVKKLSSSNENVFKYVFSSNECVAESVLYKYPTFEERTVICCSTMSGCNVGCRFCGAGDGFVKKLSAEEIVSQPKYLIESNGIDAKNIKKFQIMFMSMGEPMLNYDDLEIAIKELHEMYPNARLLISTIGPKMSEEKWDKFISLSQEVPTIGLQFSIHETTEESRNNLIPFKAKMSLLEIAERGRLWYKHTKRKPFFNYCVHDKNNSQEDVNRIYKLFDPLVWCATISVICEREEHVSAANERQRSLASEFMSKILEKGYDTRMFDPAGQDDIGGGCGQLFHYQNWVREHPDLYKKSPGYGLPILHTPSIVLS
jgi:23S rRNA (adenine2503-C2)-methyltransferase